MSNLLEKKGVMLDFVVGNALKQKRPKSVKCAGRSIKFNDGRTK